MSVRVATHTVTHRDQHDLEGGNDVFGEYGWVFETHRC